MDRQGRKLLNCRITRYSQTCGTCRVSAQAASAEIAQVQPGDVVHEPVGLAGRGEDGVVLQRAVVRAQRPVGPHSAAPLLLQFGCAVEGVERRLGHDQPAAQAAARAAPALVLLAVAAVDDVLGQQQLAGDGEVFEIGRRRDAGGRRPGRTGTARSPRATPEGTGRVHVPRPPASGRSPRPSRGSAGAAGRYRSPGTAPPRRRRTAPGGRGGPGGENPAVAFGDVLMNAYSTRSVRRPGDWRSSSSGCVRYEIGERAVGGDEVSRRRPPVDGRGVQARPRRLDRRQPSHRSDGDRGTLRRVDRACGSGP